MKSTVCALFLVVSFACTMEASGQSGVSIVIDELRKDDISCPGPKALDFFVWDGGGYEEYPIKCPVGGEDTDYFEVTADLPIKGLRCIAPDAPGYYSGVHKAKVSWCSGSYEFDYGEEPGSSKSLFVSGVSLGARLEEGIDVPIYTLKVDVENRGTQSSCDYLSAYAYSGGKMVELCSGIMSCPAAGGRMSYVCSPGKDAIDGVLSAALSAKESVFWIAGSFPGRGREYKTQMPLKFLEPVLEVKSSPSQCYGLENYRVKNPLKFRLNPANEQNLTDKFVIGAFKAALAEWQTATSFDLFDEENIVIDREAMLNPPSLGERLEAVYKYFANGPTIYSEGIAGFFFYPLLDVGGVTITRTATAIPLATTSWDATNHRFSTEITACNIILPVSDSFGDVTNPEYTGEYDLQGVFTHELGHCIGLKDIESNPLQSEGILDTCFDYSIMSYSPEREKDRYLNLRRLKSGDIEGVHALYGP